MRVLLVACFVSLLTSLASTPAKAEPCARLCAAKFPKLDCWFNQDGSHDCVKNGELCGKFKWYCASKSPTQSPSSDKVNWHVFGESIQTAKSAPRGSNPVYISAKRRP